MGDQHTCCPNCGERHNLRFPFCAREKVPTPLYVEVNALAQFLVGVPTFLEFRLLNVSESPVVLEAFNVRIGEESLQPGIYPEQAGQTIAPGEDHFMLLDRKVDLEINKVMPGRYRLDVETVFTVNEERFTMRGAVVIVFDHPGARRIHTCDPDSQEIHVFEDGALPNGEVYTVTRCGEQQVNMFAAKFIGNLKGQAGLRFVPLRIAYERKTGERPISPPTPRPRCCGTCGAVLIEGGGFCHACGIKLASPAPIGKPTESETVAYCPYCAAPRGLLRGPHRFCPVCGKPIHLYLEINHIPSYLQDVQVPTQLRLRKVCDGEIEVRKLRASLGRGANAVECDIDGFEEPGFCLSSAEPVDDFTCLVYSPPKDRPGGRRLRFSLEYACGDSVYQLTGSYPVLLEPVTVDRNTFVNQFGPRTVTAAESVLSLGTWDVDLESATKPDERKEFFHKLIELRGLQFKPVRLRVQKTSKIKVKPSLPPSPDWAPACKARIWFEHDGITHNYCLLSTFSEKSRKYGPVMFGRQKATADVRLIEVEQYLALQKSQQESKSAKEHGQSLSRVSGTQWEIQPAPDPAAFGGLKITHRSKTNDGVVSANKKLRHGESCRLGRNEQIVIRQHGFSGDIIGLRYAANAPMFDGLEEARDLARTILKSGTSPPPKLPLWPAEVGGYRLSRLFSLTGEPIKGLEDPKILEAYVLVPGWITLGSSKDACVVVPGSDVAANHAYLLHVDGHYFIMPRGEATEVYVGDQKVPAKMPWPLKPDKTDLRLGSTTLCFDSFYQYGFE